MKNKQLIHDVQWGFCWHRSAKHHFSKIHGILADQLQRKERLSLMIYVDIKINLMLSIIAVFSISGCSSILSNSYGKAQQNLHQIVSHHGKLHWGDSCVTFAKRNFLGSPIQPRGSFSPLVLSTSWSERCCLMLLWATGGFPGVHETPTNSSPFTDASSLHTDGPNAVPAIMMSIMVTTVPTFVQWLRLFLNMPKSHISAIDFSNGQPVAIESLEGVYIFNYATWLST